MAKSQYVGVDGVARKVDTGYVGVDGVARKLTKGYVGVDGVARECYSSSSNKVNKVWAKYSCNCELAYYTENEPYERTVTRSFAFDNTASGGGNNDGIQYLSTGYSFSSYGYSAVDRVGRYISSPTIEDIANATVGYYHVLTTTSGHSSAALVQEVVSISSIDEGTGFGYVNVNELYREATYHPAIYRKGSTSYGNVTALEGELPEEGTLVNGSVDGTYCVLSIDGTYYYYELLVTWHKYNCSTSGTYTLVNNTRGFSTGVMYGNSFCVYDSYSFSTSSGLKGSGPAYFTFTTSTTLEELNAFVTGKYYIVSNGISQEYGANTGWYYLINEVISLSHSAGQCSFSCSATETKEADYTAHTAYKGSTYYGEITAPIGELPEEGTLFDGAIDEDYCALEIGYNYYYYEKV